MSSTLRILTRVLGVLFTLQGVGWLLTPELAATGLGMPLLDGLGRSTQVGDFAVFFLMAGVVILLGSRPRQARLLYLPAAQIGGAAITRTLAWALHEADFAAVFIVIEIATAVVLLRAAQSLDHELDTSRLL